jgi:hypothetical protein
MKTLRPKPIASHRSPKTFGEAGLWSDCATRPLHSTQLLAKTTLRDDADPSRPDTSLLVSQPWHGCENSAPDELRGRFPYHRLTEARLVSLKPDRRLTGERTAEGWATRLNGFSQAAVASGDARFSPRVQVQQSEPRRASQLREAEEPNLLP